MSPSPSGPLPSDPPPSGPGRDAASPCRGAPARFGWAGAWLRILGGCALAGGFAAFLLARLDVEAVLDRLVPLQAGPLGLAVGCLGAGLGLRILRWWLMLRALDPSVRVSECVWPLLVSAGLNMVVPAKLGDLARLVGFRRSLAVPRARIAGTLVLERVCDLAAVVVFLALVLALLPGAGPSGVAVIVGAGSVALVLMGAASSLGGGRALHRAVTALVRHGRFAGLVAGIDRFMEAVALVRRPVVIGQLALVTATAWTVEGAIFACVAWSLGLTVDAVGPWLALVLAAVAAWLPSAPGHVGSFHYAAALGLSAAGLDWNAAAAVAVVAHLVIVLPQAALLPAYLAAAGGRWRRPRHGAGPDGDAEGPSAGG